MRTFLDFEKPIAELETKIEELRRHDTAEDGAAGEIDIADEVAKLELKVDRLLRQTYGKLTAWQKVQVARHPERPHGLAHIAAMIEDFTPLAGDRSFGEDQALIGGLGRFRGQGVVVMVHEKGHDMATRVKHNFGMPKPEGYRKAKRLMRLAEQFRLPVITLIDTAGAYPGVDAEARGQAEAIARAVETCLSLTVPMVSVVIGEGGSGGAVAIATANRVAMLEHSIYSVISPEGCASILWRSADQAQEAAEAMHLTAQDLAKLQVIDLIIAEPVGGAHRDPATAITQTGDAIEALLKPLMALDGPALKADRRTKFLEMGRHGL